MKAFPKSEKKKLKDNDRKMSAAMSENIEATLFTPEFANYEMYAEFNREQLLPGVVAKLFRDGHIAFFHRDNTYPQVEIVDTIDGKVLVVPAHFYMAELIELVDGLYSKKSKKQSEPVE